LLDVASEIGEVTGEIYDRCKSAVQTLTNPEPDEERDQEVDGSRLNFQWETFYRFIPASKALSVTAGKYDDLWVPSHLPNQENFMSQDFNYVDNLAATKAVQERTSMAVLAINTKPGTFDYITNPNVARLHTSISGSSRNLTWLGTMVNYDVTSYQTFQSGDGVNFLQLKREGNALTTGFFKAETHKQFFVDKLINFVELVSLHKSP
jgi:hypothetical protein